MSNPANSLAAYRSYSYYHVLCMCDSTETADTLATSNDLSIWDHATSESGVGDTGLGRYAPKCISNTGKYVVLINGSQDATYVITTAKWSTATAGQAVPGDRGNSIAIEGTIQVSEPKGVAFLDQIVKCSVALGVDASQVVYLLKTFFVGHLDGLDNTYPEVISDIPPVNCIAYDVTGAFTEEGGIYEMQFVSISHGASRMPQFSSIPNTLTFSAGDSLQDTFTRLQGLINDQYSSFFSSVVQEMAKARNISPADASALLRPVKYIIEVGQDYQSAHYTVTDQSAQYKNKSGCNAPAHISFPQGTSVEAAIRSIMQMSLQVKEEMAATDKKYEYKIHTTIQSKPANGGSGCADLSFDYTVYYRVERILSPRSTDAFEVLQRDLSPTQLASDPDFQKIKNNLIEFDYIYTGKNIDILEFEMKVNLGLAFLQIANMANTFKNQTDRSAAKTTKVSTEDANTMNNRFSPKPVQIPLFFGTTLKQSNLTNTQNPVITVDSAYTLSKHASIEMAEASMRITGNDQLLSMCNRATSSRYVMDGSKKVFNDETGQAEQPFSQWSNVPTFAKVKVMMPRNNDDSSLFTGKGGDKSIDYAEDFWFDGYYYIYGVDHVFDQGEFSQTLQMFALPRKNLLKSTQTSEIKNPVGAAYENTIDANPGRGHINPTFDRPGTDGLPANRADAESHASKQDLSSVEGWDTASPEVKQAILNAANQYGISPVLLAQTIGVESSFDPNAANPRSPARGLGQFMPTTWTAQIKKDPAIGVDIRAPESVQLAARFDPVYSARATASYIKDNISQVGSDAAGDVYLAHFSGPGVAKTLVNLDNSGQGNTTLRQAYVMAMGPEKGNRHFNTVLKQNPKIKETTTVTEQRTWAAKQVGGSVPKSTQTAAAGGRKVTDVVAAAVDAKTQDSKKGVQVCGKTSG